MKTLEWRKCQKIFFEAIFSHFCNVLHKIFIIILCDILSFSQQLSRIMMYNLNGVTLELHCSKCTLFSLNI